MKADDLRPHRSNPWARAIPIRQIGISRDAPNMVTGSFLRAALREARCFNLMKDASFPAHRDRYRRHNPFLVSRADAALLGGDHQRVEGPHLCGRHFEQPCGFPLVPLQLGAQSTSVAQTPQNNPFAGSCANFERRLFKNAARRPIDRRTSRSQNQRHSSIFRN